MEQFVGRTQPSNHLIINPHIVLFSPGSQQLVDRLGEDEEECALWGQKQEIYCEVLLQGEEVPAGCRIQVLQIGVQLGANPPGMKLFSRTRDKHCSL